ncbi:M23 family metallopeptidase [Phenylobacterium sp. J426]|uniref:M23 family metallopeptidase n=1 Tax=Phenylobacterium sp. J426 TaxID=2898439 RepID=UPI002151CF34|nr:M23 family metallopeptidase [Phenylobacterium sp. J426]MCR5874677.1 M23 family metallopeptidase [Phenylobacterium sp. J426]
MTHDWRARLSELANDRRLQAITLVAAVVATAAAAAPVHTPDGPRAAIFTAVERAVAPAVQPVEMELVWQGADVDGDGAPDFANPTGNEPREHDAYGSGQFGASRDGGVRRHEGVDFIATAGQTVVAPISGYITKIGYAYAGDGNLKFVEISNPALKLEARAFYVDPDVEVGQTVRVGQPIGEVRSLQRKYPGGMTDHVHLELIDRRGRRIDATNVITASYQPKSDFSAAD